MNEKPPARVLIVDDEPAQVRALCRTLAMEGYDVEGETSVVQALARLGAAGNDRSLAFDVLVTDLSMPEMDGIGFMQAAHRIDPNLVVIMMTGYATIDTAVQAMKSGALDYIVKPFRVTGILPALARAVAVRRLQIANATLQEAVQEHTRALENANRELQIANRELAAFTQTVSHDLRNPLTAMVGMADLLMSDATGPLNAEQSEYVREIRAGGQRLIGLIGHLLRFAKVSGQSLQRAYVDASSLMNEVVEELRVSTAQRPMLRLGALPPVTADRALLKQVFTNLLSNAIKFTSKVPSPKIDISGEELEQHVVYCICDNGVGFDMRHAEGLFTPFRRLHADTDFSGTGVGLSIVHRIVERHGGRVSVVSSPGQGACFRVQLPR